MLTENRLSEVPKVLDSLIPLKARVALGAVVSILLLVGAFASGWFVSSLKAEAAMSKLERDLAQKREEAVVEARSEEHQKQEKINETLRKQNEALGSINSRLTTDLARLRQRPERPPGVPETPRPACSGANGPELGAEYAVFLRRYSARAAEQDAYLAACYEALDIQLSE